MLDKTGLANLSTAFPKTDLAECFHSFQKAVYCVYNFDRCMKSLYKINSPLIAITG